MHIQMPSLPGQVDTGRRIAVGALDELHVSPFMAMLAMLAMAMLVFTCLYMSVNYVCKTFDYLTLWTLMSAKVRPPSGQGQSTQTDLVGITCGMVRC